MLFFPVSGNFWYFQSATRPRTFPTSGPRAAEWTLPVIWSYRNLISSQLQRGTRPRSGARVTLLLNTKSEAFTTSEIYLGSFSTLLVSFHLQRHMGDFVIQVIVLNALPVSLSLSNEIVCQVYGPCILLVVISWVSFWLNREATSDRISLGRCRNLARLERD